MTTNRTSTIVIGGSDYKKAVIVNILQIFDETSDTAPRPITETTKISGFLCTKVCPKRFY